MDRIKSFNRSANELECDATDLKLELAQTKESLERKIDEYAFLKNGTMFYVELDDISHSFSMWVSDPVCGGKKCPKILTLLH